MDNLEDVQNAELSEDPPAVPPRPPSPSIENAEGASQVSEMNTVDVEEIINVPDGCPDTPMHQNSYKTLKEAREAAVNDPERMYSPSFTQLRMQYKMSCVGNGMKPRFYQQDCAEAFVLGLDTGLICPTGSGKTEAFVLPLFADHTEKSKIIIVSPLNALQIDHAKRFNGYRISAAAVNGESYCDELHERLGKGEIRAIITSPEMIFKHPRFSKLFRDPKWTKNVLGIVIDEAHCILEWGKEFRREFDKLDNTRAYMASKPIFFCTATLTPSMLEDLHKKLSFSTTKNFLLNLGCERHNVMTIVSHMKGPTDYQALDFVIKEALEDPPRPLIPTLIYAEERETVLYMWLYLMRQLPADSPYRSQVEFLMASRDEIVKSIVLARFMYGRVKIMCSTEAVGMGIDARVRRVVQFGVPRTLLQWQQHAGHAGRDGEPSYALLLAEPSVFQVVTRKEPKKDTKTKGKGKGKAKEKSKIAEGTPEECDETSGGQESEQTQGQASTQAEGPAEAQDVTIKQEPSEVILSPQLKRKLAMEALMDGDELEDPDDQAQHSEPADPPASELNDKVAALQASLEGKTTEYRKHVDADMRELCMTLKCRRDVTMKAFNSPPPMRAMNVPCCDNCLLSKGDSVNNPMTVNITEYDAMLLKIIDDFADRLLKKPKPPKVVIPMPSADPDAKPVKRRVKDRLNTVKDALEILRYDFWKTHYGDTMFCKESVLPDSILSSLASEAKIVTMADLEVALPDWDFAEEMGPCALATIALADSRWNEKNEEEKKARAAIRRADTLERKRKREEEERNARLENTRLKTAEKHAEAMKNWSTYQPAKTAPTTPTQTAPTTPTRSQTPAHVFPLPPQYYASPVPPATPTYVYPQASPMYPQYHVVPFTPGAVPASPSVVYPPGYYYYPPPVPAFNPTTPIRPPSAPMQYVYPTPPFTPVASSSRLPPSNTPPAFPYPYSLQPPAYED